MVVSLLLQWVHPDSAFEDESSAGFARGRNSSAAVGLLVTNLSLAEATSFINFGAFLGFALVSICVVAYAIRRRRAGTRHPWFGYLLTRLSVTATCLGLAWLLIGTAGIHPGQGTAGGSRDHRRVRTRLPSQPA